MEKTINTLYIDYSLAEKRHSDNDDVGRFEYGNKKTKAYKIHWYKHLSTYTDTYKKKVKPILKQNIKDIIVGPTYDFIKPHVIEHADTVDFFKKTFLKLKKLKTITFEFNENGYSFKKDYYSGNTIDEDTAFYSTPQPLDSDYFKPLEGKWEDDLEWNNDFFVNLIWEIIRKKVKVIFKHEKLKSSSDLNNNFEKYIQIFNLYLNLTKLNKYKDSLNIENINYSEVKSFVEEVITKKAQAIVVLDDQSKSKLIKKFNDVELMANPNSERFIDGISINGGVDYIDWAKTKITDNERVFDNVIGFRIYESYFSHSFDNFSKNPARLIIFVKKAFLNKLPINKFANLKEVYFNYLGKNPYYEEDEQTFRKDEKFSFPKSINYKNIEVLSIIDGPPVNLSEIKNASSFDKLKVLILKNCVTGDYKNSRFLPSFQNLKHLEIDNKYSYKNIKENVFRNFEKSNNLEKIVIINLTTDTKDEKYFQNIGIDLTNIAHLKKLKFLNANPLNINQLNDLKNLTNLKVLNFHINNDPDENENLSSINEQDFSFLKGLKNLEILNIDLDLWRLNKNTINFDEVFSYFSKEIRELNLTINPGFSQLSNTRNFLNLLSVKLTKIEKLNIQVRLSEYAKREKDYFVITGTDYFSKTSGKKWKINKPPFPFFIDFKYLKGIINLKNFKFEIYNNIDFDLLNFKEIINLNKLEDIKISYMNEFGYLEDELRDEHRKKAGLDIRKKINLNDLKYIYNKIATRKEKFLLKHNAHGKTKNNENTKGLEGKYWKAYENLKGEEESICSKLHINTFTIHDILVGK